MRLFRAITAATCAIVLAVGCRDVLGIRDFDASDDANDGASDAAAEDAACEASIDTDSGLLDDVVQLALGNGFSCALNRSNEVWCWGVNDKGQIGTTSSNPALKPVLVVSNVNQVAAGADFACALTTDGYISCWGNNDRLQLGRDSGTGVGHVTTSQAAYSALTASHDHACALATNHTTICWGANDSEQSGAISNFASDASVGATATAPTQPSPTTSLVAAGDHHTCVVDQDLVYCWGLNDLGQFGAPPSGPTLSLAGVSFGAGVTELHANSTDTCVLHDASITCSGGNELNQIGSTASTSPRPIAIYDQDAGAPPPFTTFSLADEHSCFVTASGNVACVGQHNQGQLGNDDISDGGSSFAQYVLSPDGGGRLDGVIGIAVAGVSATSSQNFGKFQFHSCAIVRSGCGASGRVACWGANAHGQLGTGATSTALAVPQWVIAP